MNYQSERIISDNGGVTIIKDNDVADDNKRYSAVGRDKNMNHCVGYGASVEEARTNLKAEIAK